MEHRGFIGFDPESVPSPCYVVDRMLLEENCRILDDIQQRADVKILLALKGFSMFSTFDIIGKYLHGACASSPDEAHLAWESLGKEVHGYAAGFDERSLREFLDYCSHMVFNSLSLFERFESIRREYREELSCGLRINPQHREGAVEIYDPSAPFSRLGIPIGQLAHHSRDSHLIDQVDGYHVHNLCEQNLSPLIRTWHAVERQVKPLLLEAKWLNLGGGHHITRADYDREGLISFLQGLHDTYRQAEIYLEPGEAVALDTGILVATVLDITDNGMPLAILDTSASCHMPDVLEMPYRPHIIGSHLPGAQRYTYRLGGMTCLAGDVIGDYSFPQPLEVGQRLIFTDMAHYTMVKNTTFNGIRLPSIGTYDSRDGRYTTVRSFGYEDFKRRLS